MKCPNCGEETVNINGRHVCLDCGIEVMAGAGAQNNSLPVDVPSPSLQSENINSANSQMEEEIIPETVEPINLPADGEPIVQEQEVVLGSDINVETSNESSEIPPFLEDHQEMTAPVQNETVLTEDASLAVGNIDSATPQDAITNSVAEETQTEQIPDLSISENAETEPLKETTLEEEAMDPSILKINPSILETPVVTDVASAPNAAPEKEVPVSELSQSQGVSSSNNVATSEVGHLDSQETKDDLNKEVDLFQKEIPVDSGSPLYADKDTQNNVAAEQVSTPPPAINQNLKMDAVGFSVPDNVSGDGNLSSDKYSPEAVINNNIFSPNFEADHMEVMAASKVSSSKIIKIIIYTAISFVVLALFAIIWLKRVELLTMFGVVEETPVETGSE